MSLSLLMGILCLALGLVIQFQGAFSPRANSRLRLLSISANEQSSLSSFNSLLDNQVIKKNSLSILSKEARSIILFFSSAISALLVFSALSQQLNTSYGIFIGLIITFYLGALGYFILTSIIKAKEEKEVLFFTPLTLEAITLLVESGYGILPAIERVVNNTETNNIVIKHLERVYRLNLNGLSFTEATQIVSSNCPYKTLQHSLSHLSASQTNGGELAPALRNLAENTQLEWKLANEVKIKKLENLVVFPIFLSVIGMILMTAAIPLVPVLDLTDKIDNNAYNNFELVE